MFQQRSPLQVTLHVWHALFMREAMARITGDRLGWAWVFLEPIAHLLIFVGLRYLMGSVKYINGAEFMPWFIVGMVTFLLFSVVMNRSINAITSNRALFAYRQVHPVDTILIRAVLEGLLKTLVFGLVILGAMIFGISIVPADAIFAVFIWFVMWCFGFGIGLVLSVPVTSTQEFGKFVNILSMPLYMLSGVMFPIQFLPREVRDFILYNPLFHAVELMRSAFFPRLSIDARHQFAIFSVLDTLFGIAWLNAANPL